MSDDVVEVDPTEFEQELRDGANVVVVDTRDPAAFAAWHVDAGAATLVNVPEPELLADPAVALASVPPGARVRVICNAGIASRRAVAALDGQGWAAAGVKDGLIGWSRVLQHDEIPIAGPWTLVQFRREARGCLSYLVAAADEALVVDPAPDVQPYLDHALRVGVRIVGVLDTHVHADHLSGARELARRAGAVLHLPAASLARGLRDPDEVVPVSDGDMLAIGDQVVRIVALPGHTSDMTGVMVGDAVLIGGDSLFADGIARPDLETGDAGAADSARVLYRTLRRRVDPLADDTVLAPCHYPGGRCDGPIAPTLGAVRAAVPELALDEDTFVEQVLANMPPRPANYEAIIAVNLGEDLPGNAAARLEVGANNCAANPGWAPSPS